MEFIEDKPLGRRTTIESKNARDSFAFAFNYPNINPEVKDHAQRIEDACLEYQNTVNRQKTVITKRNIVKQDAIITSIAEKYRLNKEWFKRIILGI